MMNENWFAIAVATDGHRTRLCVFAKRGEVMNESGRQVGEHKQLWMQDYIANESFREHCQYSGLCVCVCVYVWKSQLTFLYIRRLPSNGDLIRELEYKARPQQSNNTWFEATSRPNLICLFKLYFQNEIRSTKHSCQHELFKR